MKSIKNFLSKPKNTISVAVLVLLAIAIPITGILNSQSQDIQQEASGVNSNSTPLGFGSQVGYDMASWRCKVIADANNEYSTGGQQTFSVMYNRCKTQFFADIDELASKNVKSVRLNPYIYQFIYDPNTQKYGELNSNINNLDEIINRFGQKGIKVHLVLNSVYTCSTTLPGQFDYKLFTDPTMQQQYLSGLSKFIDHYKNNTTIISYDLINEINSLIENEYASSAINQPTVCMTATPDQIKNFMSQMYDTAKKADKQPRAPGSHKFTFSLSVINEEKKAAYLDLLKDKVDFYDIHMYVGADKADNANNYYKDYPVLDKPVIHGEIGTDTTGTNVITDGNGQKCDSEPFTPGYPRQASADCQQKLLFNTQTWVEKAKVRNIDALFFHNWNNTNRFVYRTYKPNASGNFDTQSYAYTLSGDYITSQNNGGKCFGRLCDSISVTNTPTLGPSPTPNFNVIPPIPTNLRTGTITSNSVQILWNDNAINETYYRVAFTRNVSPQQWTFTNLVVNATSYIFTNLNPSSQYYFAVMACNTVGCSNTVNTSIISTIAGSPAPTEPPNYTVAPVKPSGLFYSNINNTSIKLNWNIVSNATRYDVAYTINKTPQQWSVIPNIPQGSSGYAVTGLTPNTPYYIGVRGCNSIGCSDYATGSSVNTLAAAATLTLTSSPTPTNTPTPTAAPKLACSASCTSNSQCATGYCHLLRGGTGFCRNLSCITSSSCVCN